MKMIRGLARISLLWKIAIVNLIPILLLGVVLQHYLHSHLQARAQSNATQTALAISRSEVERGLSARDLQNGLTKAEVKAIHETLADPEIKREVRAVTVWNRSLRIVYSQQPGQIGRKIFPLSNEHRSVLNGNVVSTRSGANLQVYVPLWLGRGRGRRAPCSWRSLRRDRRGRPRRHAQDVDGDLLRARAALHLPLPHPPAPGPQQGKEQKARAPRSPTPPPGRGPLSEGGGRGRDRAP